MNPNSDNPMVDTHMDENVSEQKQLSKKYTKIVQDLFFDGMEDSALDLIASLKEKYGIDIQLPSGASSDAHQAVESKLSVQFSKKTTLPDSVSQSSMSLPTNKSPLSFLSQYSCVFQSDAKAHWTAAALSQDGLYISSASNDKLQLISMSKVYNNMTESATESPILRFFQIPSRVTALDFHPAENYLTVGCADGSLSIYNHRVASSRNSLVTVQDGFPIHAMHSHPSGDFLLVAAEHPVIRLYDYATLQPFVTSFPGYDNVTYPSENYGGVLNHRDFITCVKYSPNGLLFASASRDGSIKIWDGINMKLIHTFFKAHGGAIVGSLEFSSSGHYLLSGGADNCARLWDLRFNEESEEMCYDANSIHFDSSSLTPRSSGALNSSEKKYANFYGSACFLRGSSQIITTNSDTMELVAFNTLTREPIGVMKDAFQSPTTHLLANPVSDSFFASSIYENNGKIFASKNVLPEKNAF